MSQGGYRNDMWDIGRIKGLILRIKDKQEMNRKDRIGQKGGELGLARLQAIKVGIGVEIKDKLFSSLQTKAW